MYLVLGCLFPTLWTGPCSETISQIKLNNTNNKNFHIQTIQRLTKELYKNIYPLNDKKRATREPSEKTFGVIYIPNITIYYNTFRAIVPSTHNGKCVHTVYGKHHRKVSVNHYISRTLYSFYTDLSMENRR